MIDDQGIAIDSQLDLTMAKLNKFVTENKLISEVADVWGCTPKTVRNRFQKRDLSAVEMCRMGQIEALRPLMANLMRSMADRFDSSRPLDRNNIWVLEYKYKLIKVRPAMGLLSDAVRSIKKVDGFGSALFYSSEDRTALVRVRSNIEPIEIDPFDDFFDWRYTFPRPAMEWVDEALELGVGMSTKKWFEELMKVARLDGSPTKNKKIVFRQNQLFFGNDNLFKNGDHHLDKKIVGEAGTGGQ